MPRKTKKSRKSKPRLKLFRVDTTQTEYDTFYVWAKNQKDAINRFNDYAPHETLEVEESDGEDQIHCADEAINQECEPEGWWDE